MRVLCRMTTRATSGYAKLAPKLVDALLDSIQLEEDGANEFEVRRKADAAKPLVREFVGRWKEDRQLEGDRSQKEIKGINPRPPFRTRASRPLPAAVAHLALPPA